MSEKRYSIQYSIVSKNDLKSIYSYIAFELQAKIAAKNQTSRIRENIRALDYFPEKYPLVDWEPWNELGVRKMPVDNFVVFYRVDHETRCVEIVRIFYGGRDIENIVQSETE